MIPEEEERTRILNQLYEAFNDIHPNRIGMICEENNWQLNVCIDKLVDDGRGTMIQETTYNDNYNGWQQGAVPKTNATNNKIRRPIISSYFANKANGSQNLAEVKIGNQIKAGYRIMVVMRGAPGSGKSYLASDLIRNYLSLAFDYSEREFVFSSDDYFYDAVGHYRYNINALSEAHNFNQNRVREKAASGWSPIIVDNTNMKIWEIIPYVEIAVKYGYLVELLEPNTPWRRSPGKLAHMNRHGVTRERIERILDKWEPATPKDVIGMLKNTKYTVALPQMRLLPPIMDLAEGTTSEDEISSSLYGHTEAKSEGEQFENCERQQRYRSFTGEPPKEQRVKPVKNVQAPANHADRDCSQNKRDVYSLLEEKTAAWKFEADQETVNLNSQQNNLHNDVAKDHKAQSEVNMNSDPSMFQILKGILNVQVKNEDDAKTKALERHSINCPNENLSFVHLRQIYPNKEIPALWDLFVKCKGNVDWVVDLLLNDENSDGLTTYHNDANAFKCYCTFSDNHQPNESSDTNSKMVTPIDPNNKPQPQRQRSRFSRRAQPHSAATQQLQREIENQFYINNNSSIQISNNNKIVDNDSNRDAISNCTNVDAETQTAELHDWDYSDTEDSKDKIELNFGQAMIHQLIDRFKNEFSCLDSLQNRLPSNLNVFIPRNMAKRMYMLCLESIYNYIEEERRRVIQDDEDFARFLKMPKYADCKQSPNDFKDLLDLELVWATNKEEDENERNQSIKTVEGDKHTDLATYLSQMKLCERFPDIPRDTLIDVLAANDNRYTDTLNVLASSITDDSDNRKKSIAENQEPLFAFARQEKEILSRRVQNKIGKGESNAADDLFGTADGQNSEEIKLLALQKFEDSRNLAAHHTQLRNECYQKAREAVIRGNSATGAYYFDVAKMHKTKLDTYNHLAANCIIEVHKRTHKNPELLDLHYMYIPEALGCLDIFLDCHITELRNASRCSKDVFIITGRGRHSAGGVPTIKNRVKQRLKERNLRWLNENAGLLRVKVFSASRYSNCF